MAWHKAAKVADVKAPGLARFAAEGHEYVLARVDAEQWYATDLSCTHEWAELDLSGSLVGTQLACVSHGAIFDLGKDGAVVCEPATRPLRVFPVKVEGEWALADIPAKDEPPAPDA